MGEESEDECPSSFFVGDFYTTNKDVGSCECGERYFVLDPKEYYNSDLKSLLDPHNEEEDKTTPFGCEPENLVEEQTTIVSLHEEANSNHKYDKSSCLCSIHVYL